MARIRAFQHTAARRRLGNHIQRFDYFVKFQHSAARRRLVVALVGAGFGRRFNTQPPEGGWPEARACRSVLPVSTLSRPKAAGPTMPPDGCQYWFQHSAARRRLGTTTPYRQWRHGFNTQPPEGGWRGCRRGKSRIASFQHSAARRRLVRHPKKQHQHRRFNTQPPEGGWALKNRPEIPFFGFNTQPPEGGWEYWQRAKTTRTWFQHSAARRRLGEITRQVKAGYRFQHSAARRRLAALMCRLPERKAVSTLSRPKAAGTVPGRRLHLSTVSTLSRPKAAGRADRRQAAARASFNTQPPEGGWPTHGWANSPRCAFQHSAARRRLAKP